MNMDYIFDNIIVSGLNFLSVIWDCDYKKYELQGWNVTISATYSQLVQEENERYIESYNKSSKLLTIDELGPKA